jgi:Protein of unknown function (DUF3105)
MAHRQEEKERRRQERLERERAEKAKVARRKRLQLALGALGAVAAAAVVVLLVSGTLGGDDAGAGEASAPDASNVTLPEPEIGDLRQAARAAGCTLRNPAIEGATHERNKQFAASDYKTNPPTSGNHAPDWYDDGVYEPGTTPELGKLVHTLEHGRINVQYKPGTPAETVRQLEALLAEQSDGYHMLLYENTTGMDAAVAATTWGHSLTCDEMNPQVFDAIRTFRAEYIDQGPENVP